MNYKTVTNALISCIRAGNIPFLKGPPGVGKTQFVKAVANSLGVHLEIVYLAQFTAGEIPGIPVIDSSPITINGVNLVSVSQAPPRWAINASRQPSIIFFDEVNQVPTTDQGQLMAIWSEYRVGSFYLDPQNVAMVAAGNPVNMSAGAWKLAPPARRRIVEIPVTADAVEFSDPDAFPANWGVPLPSKKLFGNEIPESLRFKYRQLIAAYVRSKPNCFEPPKDVASMSDGFFCPATAEMASDLMAASEYTASLSLERKEVAKQQSLESLKILLSGAVGTSTATDIFVFMDSMVLPPAEAVLENPDILMKSGVKLEADNLYYFLMSMAQIIRMYNKTANAERKKALLTRAQTGWATGLKLAAWLQDNCDAHALICMFVARLMRSDIRPRAAVPPKEVDNLLKSAGVLETAGISFSNEGEFDE